MYNTKKDYQKLLIDIINPLKQHYSDEKAFLNIGETGIHYSYLAFKCESFARPLWGLVPFWHGGGEDKEFEEIYRCGLVAGTDPKNPEYWGDCENYDQRFVEMAAIAEAILFAKDKLWDTLTRHEQVNLAKWLYKINESDVPHSNWQYFSILTNLSLKSVGMPYSEKRIKEGIELIDSFYIGNGWYTDGKNGACDYYVSFAIHFYSLVYAEITEKEDPERAKIFRNRAKELAKTLVYWFADTGEGLPFGRSQIYRFAQIAFWSACITSNIDVFPLDVLKGIISRHFENWMKQPIFDNGGVLTIGYYYPNMFMTENYNSSGGVYWSLKPFSILGLPDDHPFWSVDAAPMPKLDDIKLIPEANMLISRYNNTVTAYVPANKEFPRDNQYSSKYSKFAYSTKFGFSVSRSNSILRTAAPDSMLAFEIYNNIWVREKSIEFKMNKDSVYSKWSPFDGITVETIITPTPQGHIRKHKINSEIDCVAYDCGFAVSSWDTQGCVSLNDRNQASVRNNYSSCVVMSNKGNGEGMVIIAEVNTNMLSPKTRIPSIKYEIKKGISELETVVLEK